MKRNILSATGARHLRTSYQSRRTILTLSSVEGPSDPPLSIKTLPDFFDSEILKYHASRPALICREERPNSHAGPVSRNFESRESCLVWDFEEFDRNIKALARGLIGLGVRKGDRVGVVMGNTSSFAMLQWACASIGAILATINPAYRTHELINTLALAEVQHLVVVPSIRTSHYVQALASALPSIMTRAPGDIQEESVPDLKSIIVVDNHDLHKQELQKLGARAIIDWREVLLWRENTSEETQRALLQKSLQPDDVINMQFTSGTTGLPKAVSLTHTNLLNNGISIGGCMNLTNRDIVCNPPPLFHCFDMSSLQCYFYTRLTYVLRLVLGNLAAWTHGSCIVYASAIYNPKAIVNAVVEEKCTALHGVPTHFLGVLDEVEKRRKAGESLDTSSLRTGIAAGSPVPIDLMKSLIDKLGLTELTNAYGMTETSPVSFQTVPSDPLLKRVQTVGRVQPHVKAKVVDPNTGDVVPVNTPGELLVSGYLLQKGYYRNEEQTRKVMYQDKEKGEKEVWMHTGDEVVMDEEGYLSVVSRIKDIIIRGGENLFPIQIENTLTSHPGIHEAAVVAVPDSRYGEVVGAWIVRADNEQGRKLTAEEVRHVVAKEMNPQNAPAWLWFVQPANEAMKEGDADHLPKTASGKVQKHILRDWSKDMVRKGLGRISKE